MSEIIPFSPTGNDVPAHLVALFDGDGNIAPKLSINQLSYRGKVWRRIVEGEETQLTRKSAEGDVEPVPIVSLVILDHNKGRSRAYYPGSFEEGKNTAPTCFSGDGVKPDASVKEPCAATCATCPNSVKGSKITENNKQTTACSPFKRVAVVPSQAIGKHPAMLLRLAQTSIWDKDNGENEAKGWYAWDQYLDMLRARGAQHTAAVETKVKFDLRMAYPKLLFSASRWLSPEEAMAAKQRLADSADEIATILTGEADKDGMTGIATAVEDTGADPAVGAAEKAAAEKAAVDAAAAEKKAAAAKKAAEKKAAEKAAADKAAADAASAEDDGGVWGAEPAVTKAASTAAPTAAAATPVETTPVVNGTPAGLADLLDGWDA